MISLPEIAQLFWGYLGLLALGLFWLLLFNAFTNHKSSDRIDTMFEEDLCTQQQ